MWKEIAKPAYGQGDHGWREGHTLKNRVIPLKASRLFSVPNLRKFAKSGRAIFHFSHCARDIIFFIPSTQ